jgi:dihydropyrimidinase
LWNAFDCYPVLGTHPPSPMPAADHCEINLWKLVEKMTINHACFFGLYSCKGIMMPGTDADVVIVDSQLNQTVDSKKDGSRDDFGLHQSEIL